MEFKSSHPRGIWLTKTELSSFGVGSSLHVSNLLKSAKAHLPRATLPTSKLMSKIDGNVCSLDVSFCLYWLFRCLPRRLSLFLLFLHTQS